MPVVVTVTRPAVTVTATPTSSGVASSTLSAGTIAGIVVGCLLGGVLFIALVLYLLNRYEQHKFARVVNPAHDHVPAPGDVPGPRRLPSTSSRISKFFTRHSQRPSISNEPLMSPVSWPPLPSTSLVQSSGTPLSDSISPGIRDGQYGPYDLGEISQVIASGTVSRSAAPAILNIPPVRKPEQTSPWSGLGDAPPHARQTSGDDVPPPSMPPEPQPKLFIHRMLQSRARASDGVFLAHRPSLDFTQASSSFRADEERLLVEAERTALRDAENAQRAEEEVMPNEEDDWGETQSTESIYSQISAPIDHSAFFSDPASRQNSSSSLPRRKSSRKRSRTPAPPTELPPVAEVPDTPRVLEGQSDSRCVSHAGNSSLDGQLSHGATSTSRPMSSVIDQPSTLPLLTSANFGKDSTTSGTPPGSISSTAGWGSGSSGRASRYPSLAPSSIASQSGPRSDAGTNWHHPPSGLASLTLLQIGPLWNPHSPVEERPEHPDVSLAPYPVPARRAHLREGTVSSMPEVERRTVMQGGIAHIDVAL